MLNHKCCCCYTYILCAVVGFTLRLGRRGYITSPRPPPSLFKMSYISSSPPPLYIYIFNTTFLVCKRSLLYIYLYICVVALLTAAVHIHSFFFFFVVVYFPFGAGAHTCGIFNHEFLHFFIYMLRVKTMARGRGRESLTSSNAIGGR